MASIYKRPNGHRWIQFFDGHGKRHTLRLGKLSQRDAETVRGHVLNLLAARRSGNAIAAGTALWLADRDAVTLEKLAAVGLIEAPEAKAIATLGPFLADYIESRTDIKPLTKRHLTDAKRRLVVHFGDGMPLAEITPGDADEFRRKLSEKLGENTVRRMCGRAKQFFRAAVRKRLLSENPFGDMAACNVKANRARDYFISETDAQKVLAACPDAQWRLLFALSRYGGLRCPSEHLALRWGDVDWAAGKIRVSSPKTEHHEGRESRLIPIFPELRPHLEAAWEQAEAGTEYVITRYRHANANLRTQFERIIRRAGLMPWPKLFHNLRATRQTELAQHFPMHVVCEWIGNSQGVAMQHYLRTTEADYLRAIQGGSDAAEGTPSIDATVAKQKAKQQASETGGNARTAACDANNKSPVLPGFSASCDVSQIDSVPPLGLEPRTL